MFFIFKKIDKYVKKLNSQNLNSNITLPFRKQMDKHVKIIKLIQII